MSIDRDLPRKKYQESQENGKTERKKCYEAEALVESAGTSDRGVPRFCRSSAIASIARRLFS